MDPRALLVWVHILLFVFWLGADLGVYIAAIWVKNPALSLTDRMVLLRIATAIDLAPRLAFVLMMPVGLTLAVRYGLPIGQAPLLAIWLLALIWLAGVLILARSHGNRLGQVVARVQFVFLSAAGIVFVSAGLALAVDGTIVPGWLAWKVVLYGVIFFIAIGIDIAFRPVGPAFARLAAEGSTPAVEAAIRKPVNASLVVVTALYLVLLVTSFLGTVKPDFTP